MPTRKTKKTRTEASAAKDAVAARMADPFVAECVQLLTRFRGLLGPVKSMTAAEVRRSTKAHKKSGVVIAKLLDVCELRGLRNVGDVTLADMRASWDRAAALRTVGGSMTIAEKVLRDATFQAKRDTWTKVLVFYATLRRLAKNDGALKDAISEVEAFFKEQRKKKSTKPGRSK